MFNHVMYYISKLLCRNKTAETDRTYRVCRCVVQLPFKRGGMTAFEWNLFSDNHLLPPLCLRVDVLEPQFFD